MISNFKEFNMSKNIKQSVTQDKRKLMNSRINQSQNIGEKTLNKKLKSIFGQNLNGNLSQNTIDYQMQEIQEELQQNEQENKENGQLIDKSEFDYSIKDYVYNKKDLIGQGSYGNVYKGINVKNLQNVAIKQINTSNFKDIDSIEALKIEIQVMKQIQSDYVVKMLDFFQTKQNINLVLEYCQDGDLQNYLEQKGGRIQEQQAIKIIYQMLQGYKDLLSNGYIHRDLKPANTLLSGQLFKLADFGMAAKTNQQCNYTEQVGSPLYMSPQILQNQIYTEKCDIWSMGLILYQMIFGKTPWPARDVNSLVSNVKRIPLRFPYDLQIRSVTKKFLVGCLEKEENKRFNWQQVFNHPVFQDMGQFEEKIKFDKESKNILKEIQTNMYVLNIVYRQNEIDIQKIFDTFNIQQNNTLSDDEFYNLVQVLDYNVTFHECKYLFDVISKSNNYITYQDFIAIFAEYDFVDLENKGEQILNDIKEIIMHNDYDLQSIFSQYDLDKGGDLDLQEFIIMMKAFLPGLTIEEIKICFNVFDDDGNGAISFQEFSEHLYEGRQRKRKTNLDKIKIKVSKLFHQIKLFVQENQINYKELYQRFDKNNNDELDLNEFSWLMANIDNQLPLDEIELLFDYLDENKDGAIQLLEFNKIFN